MRCAGCGEKGAGRAREREWYEAEEGCCPSGRDLSATKNEGSVSQSVRNRWSVTSSFLILAALEKAAAVEACKVVDLVPWDEVKQYV